MFFPLTYTWTEEPLPAEPGPCSPALTSGGTTPAMMSVASSTDAPGGMPVPLFRSGSEPSGTHGMPQLTGSPSRPSWGQCWSSEKVAITKCITANCHSLYELKLIVKIGWSNSLVPSATSHYQVQSWTLFPMPYGFRRPHSSWFTHTKQSKTN